MGVKASLEKRFAGSTRLQEGCVLKKDLKAFQKERWHVCLYSWLLIQGITVALGDGNSINSEDRMSLGKLLVLYRTNPLGEVKQRCLRDYPMNFSRTKQNCLLKNYWIHIWEWIVRKKNHKSGYNFRGQLNKSTPCVLTYKMPCGTFFLCEAPSSYPTVSVNWFCIIFGR